MPGTLKHTLVVRHPETLVATPLRAGEPVPEWADGLVSSDDLDGAGEKPAPSRGRGKAKPADKDA